MGTTNTESISLKDLNPGTYYAKVYGNNNATNSYQLYLNAPVNSNTGQPQNDWTVMVYMTASDLAKYALADINEMEYASSLFPNTVKFSVLWDQSSSQQTYSTPGNSTWGDTGRAIIRPDNNNPNLQYITTSQDSIDYPLFKDENILVPYYSPTLPTIQHYQIGEFRRYFCKKTNEIKYIEIDKKTYDSLVSKSPAIEFSLYLPFYLDWQLTGVEEQVARVNKNNSELTAQRLRLPGLLEYLRFDFTKYYK